MLAERILDNDLRAQVKAALEWLGRARSPATSRANSCRRALDQAIAAADVVQRDLGLVIRGYLEGPAGPIEPNQ